MQVKIEKLVFGGQGLARSDGQVIFVWGGLPGEEVEIKVLKKKKNFVEGVVINVLSASPDRVKPAEEHFLSCSPWQTIGFEKENEWKKTIAEETYSRLAGIKDLNLEIVSGTEEYGYRNKMEYNFTAGKNGGVSLAFHHRGTHDLYEVEKCVLADKKIQESSAQIVNILNTNQVPLNVLKSLIVRSDKKGVAAVLFVTNREFLNIYPELSTIDDLVGWQVYFSNPFSPASVPTELIGQNGKTELDYILNGVKLSCGLLSFFQINPSIFEETLKDIGQHLSSGPARNATHSVARRHAFGKANGGQAGGRVVDYYSGVGAIGLALHDKYKEAVLIEENREAAEFAEMNIKKNGFKNVKVVNSLSETAKAEIGEDDIVILDPPRTGLHKDFTKELINSRPKKIIYLSCGLDTHARDISVLSLIYKPVFWKLYNFFPHTPHIEGLCVLERK
ncbi:MAG: TRAM domain-containing protein [Patescibacteria group bacterium]|jgi:23S rRNA (uracil1939-C5)-methyltransferase